MRAARDDAREGLLLLSREELAEDLLPLGALQRELLHAREQHAPLLLRLLVRLGECNAAHALACRRHRRLRRFLHRRGEARDLLVHQGLVVDGVSRMAPVEVLLKELVGPKALVADAAAVHCDAFRCTVTATCLPAGVRHEGEGGAPLLLRRAAAHGEEAVVRRHRALVLLQHLLHRAHVALRALQPPRRREPLRRARFDRAPVHGEGLKKHVLHVEEVLDAELRGVKRFDHNCVRLLPHPRH